MNDTKHLSQSNANLKHLGESIDQYKSNELISPITLENGDQALLLSDKLCKIMDYKVGDTLNIRVTDDGSLVIKK